MAGKEAKGDVPMITLDGDILVIRVDLAGVGVPSGSGKSMNLGTSRGNHPVSELVKLAEGTPLPEAAFGVSVGFNVYRPNKK